MKNIKIVTFATYLTLLRLCAAPILVPFLIVHYLPYSLVFYKLAIATLFLFFSFTDFLDGFFARRYNQITKLGAALDHLADKFLTFSAYIALVAIGRMNYWFAIALIGREFFMLGLREIALEYHLSVSVSWLGKIKTVIHIMLIFWLIIFPLPEMSLPLLNFIEVFLLWGSLAISWLSALNYSIQFYAQCNNR